MWAVSDTRTDHISEVGRGKCSFYILCENAAMLADEVLYGVFFAEINFAHLKKKQMKEAKTDNQ